MESRGGCCRCRPARFSARVHPSSRVLLQLVAVGVDPDGEEAPGRSRPRRFSSSTGIVSTEFTGIEPRCCGAVGTSSVDGEVMAGRREQSLVRTVAAVTCQSWSVDVVGRRSVAWSDVVVGR